MGAEVQHKPNLRLHRPWEEDASPCAKCPLRPALLQGRSVGYEFVGEPPYDAVFVGEAPGKEEVREGRPFIGPSGSLLREALRQVGVRRYVLVNSVMCAPFPEGERVVPPPPEAVSQCSAHLMAFLGSLSPRPPYLFLLGKTASEALLPLLDPSFQPLSRISQYSGKYWGSELGGFRVFPLNHPAYILRQGGTGSSAYEEFLSSLRSAFQESFELPPELAQDRPVSYTALRLRGEVPATPQGTLNPKVFDLDSFEEGFALISSLREVSFDIETSGKSEVAADRSLIYVGLGNHQVQVGFDLRRGNPRNVPRFLKKLYRYLKDPERRVIVFNQSYEAGAFFQMFGDFPVFWDVFSMVKAIGLPKGLKESADAIFACGIWSDAALGYVELVEEMSSNLETFSTYLLVGPDSLKEKDRERVQRAIEASGLDQETVVELFHQVSARGGQPNLGWELVPPEVLSTYNAYDIRWTHELYLFLYPLYPESVWEVYQKQEALGSLLHLVGIAYDRARAEELTRQMSEVARDSLYLLVSVPRLQEAILKNRIRETKIREVPELKELFSLVHRKALNEGKALGIYKDPEALEARKKAYKEFMDSSVLNPSSTVPEYLALYRERYARVVGELGRRYREELRADLEAAPSLPPEEAISRLSRWFNPSSSKRFFPVFHSAISHPKLQVAAFLHSLLQKGGEDFVRSMSEAFGPMTEWVSRWEEIRDSLFPDKGEADVRVLLSKNWEKLSDGLKDEYIETLYLLFRDYLGEDLSDYPASLSRLEPDLAQSLEMLVQFRLYKKAIKVIDAFLAGKMGEGLVYRARERDFHGIPVPVEDHSGDKDYYRTEFLVNFADTRRWTSRFHTIPTGTEVRECYIPRWGEDGLWLHFDYSQMELRALAAISKDENMLAAFESGADIHRYVASRIYGVPMDQVTSHQRKNAKGASFSLVYGQTAAGLAMQYLRGNIAEAERIFSSFFQEFPRVRDYISLMHAYAAKHGHVKTLFGDYLDVARDQPDWRRRAQNYPIQSISSSVAALAGWSIWEESRRLGLRAVPVAFTHDALDFDLYAADLLPFLDLVFRLAREVPRSYGIPADIEVSLGTSLYGGLTLEPLGDGSFKVHGEARVYEAVLSRLGKHHAVESQILSRSKTVFPLGEIFSPKRVISLSMGKEVEVLEAHLRLVPL